jgi:hypothetical protein
VDYLGHCFEGGEGLLGFEETLDDAAGDVAECEEEVGEVAGKVHVVAHLLLVTPHVHSVPMLQVVPDHRII